MAMFLKFTNDLSTTPPSSFPTHLPTQLLGRSNPLAPAGGVVSPAWPRSNAKAMFFASDVNDTARLDKVEYLLLREVRDPEGLEVRDQV